MNIKAVGTKLPEETEKRLIAVFQSAYNGLQQTTEMFFTMRRLAKRDLSEKFEENELKALVDMFNGTIFEPKIAQKTTLIAEIEDSEQYEGTVTKWGANLSDLVYKVQQLTEMQCFWLMFECWAFWHSNPTDAKNLDKFVSEFA